MCKNVLFTFIFLFIYASLYALPIDLTQNDIFIRKGFQKHWLNTLPADEDALWLRVPGKKGDRSVIIRELKLEGVPEFKIFDFKKHNPETFTLVTHFFLKGQLKGSSSLGLYLAQIGMNWEVYVNGSLIKKEVYLNKDGEIVVERAVRGELIELGYDFLKEGENILTFKIIGDPTEDRTGLFMKENYLIGRFSSLLEKKRENIDLIFISLYLFFGLYHLLLFVMRRKEALNLYYGLGSVFLAGYMLCRIKIIFTLVLDTEIIKNIEYMLLFSFLPVFLAYGEKIIRNRISRFTKIYGSVCLLMGLTQIFILRETMLRAWQFTAPLILLYICMYNIVIPFRSDIEIRFRKYKQGSVLKRMGYAFIFSITKSVPGNILIGSIVMMITMTIDIIMISTGYPVNYSRYGFFVVFTGIGVMQANRFIEDRNKLEEYNIHLEEEINERVAELIFDDIYGRLQNMEHFPNLVNFQIQENYSDIKPEAFSTLQKLTTNLLEISRPKGIANQLLFRILDDIQGIRAAVYFADESNQLKIFSSVNMQDFPYREELGPLLNESYHSQKIQVVPCYQNQKEESVFFSENKHIALFIPVESTSSIYGVLYLERESREGLFTREDGKRFYHVVRNLMVFFNQSNVNFSITESKEEYKAKIISSNTEKKINRAIAFIREHYNTPLTREKVGEYIGMNHDYFGKAFQKFTKKTFRDFLNEIRIENSLPLLRDEEVLITNIAYSVGFDNISTFNRVFRKVMKSTPSKYREKQRGLIIVFEK